MRKIISLILLASMLIAAFPVSAISYNDIYECDYTSEITQLSNIGIMNGYEDGTFRPDDVMTRGELATVLVRVFGFNDKDLKFDENLFYDVKEEHFAKNSIMYCAKMGLMHGYGDGTFRPDQPVSYNEAVKIIVCALGYYVLAENNGGYPSGYSQQAGSIGILKGVGANVQDKITRGQLAKLIYNSLNTKLLTVTSYGDSYELETTGETLLTRYLKMDIVKGKLISNGYTKLEFVSDIDNDKIMIDNVVLSKNSNYNGDFLGRYVEAIYKREDLKLVSIVAPENKNDILSVRKRDIKNVVSGKITYMNNSDEEDILLDNSRKVVRNGEFDFDYSLSDLMTAKDAQITFIDNDLNGRYDVISVNEWETYIINSRLNQSGIIRDIKDASKIVNINDYDDVIIKDTDGNILSYDEIGEVHILNIIKNEDYLDIVVVNKITSGTITENGTDEAGEYYTVNDENMYLSDSYIASSLSQLSAGDYITAYFNLLGDIAYVEKGSESKYSFGVLVDYKKVKNGPEYDYYAKIFDRDENINAYKTAEKITINGTRYTVSTDEAGIRSALTYINSEGNADRGVSQIVAYSLDKDNNIKEIYTADTGLSDNAKLYKFVPSSTLYYGTSTYSFGGVVNMNDNTWILAIPEGDLKDIRKEDFAVYTKNRFVTDDYQVEFYTTYKNQPVASIVTIHGSNQPSDVSYDGELAIITDVVGAADSEGNKGIKVKWFALGKDNEALLNDDFNLNNLPKKGEIVRLAIDKNNKIAKVYKYLDSYSLNWISGSTYLGNPATNYYSATARIMFSYVTDVRDGYIRTGFKKEIPSAAELALMECTKVDGSLSVFVVETPTPTSLIVREGDIGDIEVLDSVVMRHRGGIPKEIYVIKQVIK